MNNKNQHKFHKNTTATKQLVVPSSSNPATKRPFDKKKWRMQKYDKKYKLQQWEEKRKKHVSHEYYKDAKQQRNVKKFNVEKIYEEYGDDQVSDQETNTATTTTAANKRRNVDRQEETMRTREELQQKKAERAEKLREMKRIKAEKFKQLNRKTKRGQPLMKTRIEMLFDKIQASIL